MILYHGSTVAVNVPKIIKTEYGRDFGFGFYTTDIQEQAARWAVRNPRSRHLRSFINLRLLCPYPMTRPAFMVRVDYIFFLFLWKNTIKSGSCEMNRPRENRHVKEKPIVEYR